MIRAAAILTGASLVIAGLTACTSDNQPAKPVAVAPTWENCPNGYVALTFDDGPDSRSTVLLLQALKSENIKATMFVVGERAQKYPELIRAMVEHGHSVQNHSWAHHSATGDSDNHLPMTEWEFKAQLNRTAQAITMAGAPKPTMYRPPFGDRTPEVDKWISDSGYLEVGWTTNSRDTKKPPAMTIAATVRAAPNGGVVVLHDKHIHLQTIEAIPLISKALQEEGKCPGQIVRSPKLQRTWEGWSFSAVAVEW